MSAILINPGGPGDKRSIALETSKRRRIPNEQFPERPTESMQAARRQVTDGHPGRIPRSLSATYNCVGMVFANRRTSIDPEYVPAILADDGFALVEQLADVHRGDVVVYTDDHGDIAHVGIVIANELIFGTRQVLVLSQFGRDGEYFHPHNDVPDCYGKNIRFYSERRDLSAR
ncbi:MAG: hypothetical protein U0R19_27340 [Bryobacteraceae bacterium]